MMQTRDSEPDFTKPWQMSDVILVVENSELHVHKVILAMCSPVFERMFTSGFKEKEDDKIPLPEKKSEEIKEMLLVLYPFAKPITGHNVDFLLSLAREYQIDKLTARCEEYLLADVGEDEDKAVERLITAQSFNLEELQLHCIDLAKYIEVDLLEAYDSNEKISLENKVKILGKRSKHLEIALSNVLKSYRTCLTAFGNAAREEVNGPSYYRPKLKDNECFTYIKRATEKKYSSYLTSGKNILEDLQKVLKTVKVLW